MHKILSFKKIILSVILAWLFTPSLPLFAGSPLSISAINPGYTVDGVSNVDEYIELKNNTDDVIELTSYKLRYTNSSGNASILYEFLDDAVMEGEYLLLRFDKSPEVLNATSIITDDTYNKTLAFSGGLELLMGDKVVSSVCWTGKDGCYKPFKSAAPTVLVNFSGAEFDSEKYTHEEAYMPHFDPSNPALKLPEISSGEQDSEKSDENELDTLPAPPCHVKITEIFSYYQTKASEQFIELQNGGAASINLSNCYLVYKNKRYQFPEAILAPDQYYVYKPGITLTKNPTTENLLEIIDLNGQIIESVAYPHGQKKNASYALIDGDWEVTYYLTPGEANLSQEYQTCPVGKVINLNTGNCVNAPTISETTACPAGKYRNPATGRCKNYEEENSTECKEGYERNPETNRCRKIKDPSPLEYPIIPSTGEVTEKQSFTALWAILAIVAVLIIYIIYQYRVEIKYTVAKILKRS